MIAIKKSGWLLQCTGRIYFSHWPLDRYKPHCQETTWRIIWHCQQVYGAPGKRGNESEPSLMWTSVKGVLRDNGRQKEWKRKKQYTQTHTRKPADSFNSGLTPRPWGVAAEDSWHICLQLGERGGIRGDTTQYHGPETCSVCLYIQLYRNSVLNWRFTVY